MANWVLALCALLHAASLVRCFDLDPLGTATKVVPLEQQSLLETEPTGSSYHGNPGQYGSWNTRSRNTDDNTESSLEQRMLEKELKKLPFSRHELGEGVKMRTKLLQRATMGGPEEDYARYQKAADSFDPRVEKLRKELRKLKPKKEAVEKSILKHKHEANALYEKSRFMVPEKHLKELEDEHKKVEQSTEHWRIKAETPSHHQIQKLENKLSAIHANMSDVRQKQQEAFDAKLRDQEKAIAEHKKAAQKKYYVDSNQFNEESEKIAQTREEIKDLKMKVGDVKKGKKELRANFKQQEKQELKDVKKGNDAKLAAEKRKEEKLRGELKMEQKQAVNAVQKMEQDEKVMAKALKANQELELSEKRERAALAAAERDAASKAAGEASNLLQVKLKQEIDQQKEKSSAEIASGIRERVKEETELSGEELEAAVADEIERHKIREKALQTDLKHDEQQIRALKRHEKIDILRAEQRVALQHEENRTQLIEDRRKALDGKEMFTQQKLKEDEKLKVMEAKLEDEKVRESAILSQEEAEAANFKQEAKQLETGLQNRAGARQTAARLALELRQVRKHKKTLLFGLNGDAGNATDISELGEILQQGLEAANSSGISAKQAVVTALSDKEELLEKEAEQQKHKLERARYEAKLSKHKARDLELELKRLHLDHELLKQHAKNGQKISDFGGTQKRRAKFYEGKAKAELREQRAAGKELEMYKARLKLLQAQVRRQQDRGDRFKRTRNDEAANAKEILGKTEARWSDRLLKNEGKHAQDVKRLKNAMEKQQASSDKDAGKLEKELAKAQELEATAENKAGNTKVGEKYAIDLVGKQKAKLKSTIDYMTRTQSARQKYNKKYFEEHRQILAGLKKRLAHFQNSKKYSALQYKILQLKQKLSSHNLKMEMQAEASRTKPSKVQKAKVEDPWVHVKDLGTLLTTALDQINERAKKEKLSAKEKNEQVNRVVTNIVNVVMSRDKREADELVTTTLANPGRPSYHYSKMFDPYGTKKIEVDTARKQNAQELEPNAFVLPTT